MDWSERVQTLDFEFFTLQFIVHVILNKKFVQNLNPFCEASCEQKNWNVTLKFEARTRSDQSI